MTRSLFSWSRWWSIVLKEFLQLRRDRITFGMIVGMPIVQLALFGFAINTDPKHLPTAVIMGDPSPFTRSFVAAMKNSDYFDVVETLPDEQAGRRALAQGRVQIVLSVPADFSRRVLRGERPSLLVEADATDPTATGNALAALPALVQPVADKNLTGPLAHLNGTPPAFDVQMHRLYNPEGISQYNIVPGLRGIILTMTMVMMTGLAMTRERERGTMENLLATPALPVEVMTGKIVPYVIIGLVQVSIILAAARYVFHVPFEGGLIAIYLAALLFIAATLTVGITLSSLAQNQLQAMQLTFFYFLPSLLLSGFMFPFAGMPRWAQFIGNLLPLTYFNRLTRGILLKGNGWVDLWPSVWP
ncbi:MAG: ABC transporter permease, partial [Steroidobacteraceae bacterium]